MKTNEMTRAAEPRATTPMTTEQVARRLVALCRDAKWETAQRELYAADAVSIEPQPSPMFDQETRGLEAIVQKGKKFESMIEQMHSIQVSEPVVAPSSFAMSMQLDVSFKGQGRMQMGELCVYEVKDGRIASERFFM